MSFRYDEVEASYKKYIAEGKLAAGCVLCAASSLVDFEHWRIIKNEFPYGRIASLHDMIIPKRHITEVTLTEAEKSELYAIKNTYINEHYNFVMEAANHKKTVPAHFHLHLIVSKDNPDL